jgi:ribosomal protein S18 acetylase RimI-like enzyme
VHAFNFKPFKLAQTSNKDKMFIETVSDENQIVIIENLAHEIWNEYFTAIIGKAQVDYMLEKFQSKKVITEQIENGFLYFLIKNNNVPAGYIGVIPEHKQLFLSKFYITLAERGKGHGRKAMEFLEELAIEKNVSKISLTVNRNNLAAINAYKKLGFENRGSTIQDIGNDFVMDDYKMEKKIYG